MNSAHPQAINETRLRVRYAETDQMGVVYHSNHFIWFEVGRVELLRQLGFSYRDMESKDERFIAVAEAKCRYRAPGALRRRGSGAHAVVECAQVSDPLWLRIAARGGWRSAGGRRDHAHRHRSRYESCCTAGEVFEGISRSRRKTETETLLNALHINGNDLTLEAVREVAADRRAGALVPRRARGRGSCARRG